MTACTAITDLTIQVNPRKSQRNQFHPTEAERYAKKLLAKAEVIVASANRIWGKLTEAKLFTTTNQDLLYC